jgi:hypothetical protein
MKEFTFDIIVFGKRKRIKIWALSYLDALRILKGRDFGMIKDVYSKKVVK